MTTKNAAQAKAWRSRNPDRYQRSLKRQAARKRALRRLADLHPDDFDRLYAEELLKS